MPDDEFAEVRAHRNQSIVIAASAVSVVVLVTAAVIGVRSWRDTAAHSPAAHGVVAAASSSTPAPSPVASLSAVSASEPAFSAPPVVSPAPISSPPAQPSTTPPVSRHTSPAAPTVAQDNAPNFKVNVQLSPTHVVWGHPVRVTVTVVNAGGVFDRSVVMFVQGSDPSDNVSDAMAPCTANTGSISCPITNVRPGHTWSFTFTFIPGPFPGTDGFADPVGGAFNYADRYGQQQESPLFSADLMLFDPTASSSPTSSGAPSDTPSPSVPPASAASTTATSAPQ